MGQLRFEWDQAKSRLNERKHGVSFDEASTAFLDENAQVYFDPEHSDDEDRFILLGMSARLKVLVVCHCYRPKQSTIRLISARRANRHEQADYWR